jgi:hypothetical protein
MPQRSRPSFSHLLPLVNDDSITLGFTSWCGGMGQKGRPTASETWYSQFKHLRMEDIERVVANLLVDFPVSDHLRGQ